MARLGPERPRHQASKLLPRRCIEPTWAVDQAGQMQPPPRRKEKQVSAREMGKKHPCTSLPTGQKEEAGRGTATLRSATTCQSNHPNPSLLARAGQCHAYGGWGRAVPARSASWCRGLSRCPQVTREHRSLHLSLMPSPGGGLTAEPGEQGRVPKGEQDDCCLQSPWRPSFLSRDCPAHGGPCTQPCSSCPCGHRGLVSPREVPRPPTCPQPLSASFPAALKSHFTD